MAQSVSNAVAAVVAEHAAPGPSHTRTEISGDVITVVMQRSLSRAEQTLSAAGRGDDVLRFRASLQAVTGDRMRSEVERITGRKVAAFMSNNHIDPDLAVEIFVLEARVEA